MGEGHRPLKEEAAFPPFHPTGDPQEPHILINHQALRWVSRLLSASSCVKQCCVGQKKTQAKPDLACGGRLTACLTHWPQGALMGALMGAIRSMKLSQGTLEGTVNIPILQMEELRLRNMDTHLERDRVSRKPVDNQ